VVWYRHSLGLSPWPDSSTRSRIRRRAFMDIRVAVRERAACKGRVNLARPDVPKRALLGPFFYVESLRPAGRSSFGTTHAAVSVPNEQPVAARIGHAHMPGSFSGIRPTFPATSLTGTRSSSRAPAPAQPSGIALRSRSRRLGGAFVTTRPEPAALVRVVTNHGSAAQKRAGAGAHNQPAQGGTRADQSHFFHTRDQ